MLASLTPYDKRPHGMTQDRIAEQIRERLAALPGINLVMSQPISDRVDEMVSGVRADVAVMLYGDDLNTLVEKANNIAKSSHRHSRNAGHPRRPRGRSAISRHRHRPLGHRALRAERCGRK